MIKRTLEAIAQLSGGVIADSAAAAGQSLVIQGVTTDSRAVQHGQLFVPLSGDNFEGHDYVASAFESGAAAALWQRSRPVPQALSEQPLILVKDTLTALQQLASSYRDELPARIIGITGSNGKTTTKDMVAAAIGAELKVHKTDGNFNNHIGLPLTVLRMDETFDVAVLEMGMSDFGEIGLLSRIAKPDAAIITNIGEAHMQQLGSRAGIAKAKLEIAAGLKSGGLLLINGDEPLLIDELTRTTVAEGVRLETFGGSETCDWTAENVHLGVEYSSYTVHRQQPALVEGNTQVAVQITIPVPGLHNVHNSLAAIAVADEFGVQADAAARGLATMKLTGMRIQPVKAFNGATVLNDAYNANPTAVRAALDLVEQLSGFRCKWVVLGDMMELGPEEAVLHYEVGEYITPARADVVLTYGKLAENIAAGAANVSGGAERVRHFIDKADLAEWLRLELDPRDLVLVKGSRSMRMEEIVHALGKAE